MIRIPTWPTVIHDSLQILSLQILSFQLEYAWKVQTDIFNLPGGLHRQLSWPARWRSRKTPVLLVALPGMQRPGGQQRSAAIRIWGLLQDWVNIANATGAALEIVPVAPSSWDEILNSGTAAEDYPGAVSYIYSPFTEIGALNMSVFEGTPPSPPEVIVVL